MRGTAMSRLRVVHRLPFHRTVVTSIRPVVFLPRTDIVALSMPKAKELCLATELDWSSFAVWMMRSRPVIESTPSSKGLESTTMVERKPVSLLPALLDNRAQFRWLTRWPTYRPKRSATSRHTVPRHRLVIRSKSLHCDVFLKNRKQKTNSTARSEV